MAGAEIGDSIRGPAAAEASREALTGPSGDRRIDGLRARLRRRWPNAGASLLGLLLTLLAAEHGGYYPPAWGWSALLLLWAALLGLILRTHPRLTGRELTLLAAVTGLLVWTLISNLWTASTTRTMLEGQRDAVYVGAVAAVLLGVRPRSYRALLGSAWLAIALVCAYALATRLFPERLGLFDEVAGYRLSEPLGYWNALGIFSAMGVVLALGLVAHGRGRLLPAAAAGSLLVLVPTLYFTFSRGAWAALGIGLAAAVFFDRQRLRLIWSALVVAPASIVCVFVASGQEALRTEDVRAPDAVAEGHSLAVIVVSLALASGVVAFGAIWISRRVGVSRRILRGVDTGLAMLSVVGVVAALVVAGGPSQALNELREHFDAPVAAQGANLNDRLFSISGNGREESIRVAWDAARERPVVGHGAGSYEYIWYEQRPSEQVIRDAHSLYAEMLAELGIVGLVLLCLALLAPLAAAVRARHSRFVPAATGAYCAWIAHSAMDWHWEVVGVTLVALLAGGVALLASERGRLRPLSEASRWPLVAVSVALTAIALVSLVGNQALFAGREALARGDWREAAEHARRAESLLVWSFEPHVVLGDAAAGSGDRALALEAYRDATAIDGRNWAVWLRLAQVARGNERRAAYRRVHELNPRERELPGEDASPG